LRQGLLESSPVPMLQQEISSPPRPPRVSLPSRRPLASAADTGEASEAIDAPGAGEGPPGQGASEGEASEPSHRRKIIALVVAGLLGAGVWFLIGQAASYSRLFHAIQTAQPWWLVAAVAGAMLGYVGYAVLYRVMVRADGGPRPRPRLALRVTMAVFGASVIATSAGRLGTEYWTLRQMRERPPRAWSRVLAMNTAQWAILAALALVGAAALLAGAGRGAPFGVELAWLLALPVCAVPAVYVSARSRRSLSEDRGGWLRRGFATAVRGLVLMRFVAARRRPLARAVAGSVLHWGGELLTVWAALRAFGVDLGFPALVVGYATGYASTMLPLPAGGAGGVDAASTFALTLVGVPLGPALLATLVQRLCTYWLPLGVAAIGARSIKRLPADLAAVPRPEPKAARA
jgi:uncharacterized membrane protein YbhN (UPF0104 family)